MDVVYPVRAGENEELRFSLRSLQNVPHGDVWVIGGCPRWLNKNAVKFISRSQGWPKYKSTTDNILTACRHPNVSDDFILMNDDFLIMERMEGIPSLHRGPIEKVIEEYRRRNPRGQYFAGMVETNAILQYYGINQVLSYELHVPMVVNKEKWIEAHFQAARIRRPDIQCPHRRTFYGNYFNVGGVESMDFKIYNEADKLPDWPFISTKDSLLRRRSRMWHLLEERFPVPSRYESGTST